MFIEPKLENKAKKKKVTYNNVPTIPPLKKTDVNTLVYLYILLDFFICKHIQIHT